MQLPMAVRDHRYWKEKRSFVFPASTDYAWTLLAVEEGRFRYEIDNADGEARSGDIVICPPYVEFRRAMLSPLSFHYIKCLSADEQQLPQANIPSWIRDLFAYKITIADQDRLYSNFRNLLSVCELEDPSSERWRSHLVNDIWLLVQREADHVSQISGIRDKLMLEAKAWIETHFDEPISIRTAADRFHLHPVHFARRFRTCFGVAPSQHIAACRIGKAKRLLRQSDYTIDHIAQLCGYDNGFYFSRVFTKHEGLNPSEYRKIYAPPFP